MTPTVLLSILLFSPIACSATFVFFSGIASYYIQKRSNQNIHFPPPTVKHMLKVMLKEWFAATLWVYGNAVSRIIPWVFKLSHAHAPSSKHSPIFLMPGYLDTPYSWRHCIHFLQQWRHSTFHALTLKSLFSRLLRLSKGFKEKLETVPHGNAYLVGFSMGGILAAYYNEYIARKPFKKIITIASPLHGTYLAQGFPGENAMDMRRDSTVLKELRERMKQNVHTQYYHIASQDDNIVLPWDSALLSPKNTSNRRQFILTGYGHASLLRSESLAKLVHRCLEEDAPREHNQVAQIL